MPMDHDDFDECARWDIELPLFVLGFDNPVIASDLEVGDFFQVPSEMFPGRWYEALEVWEPGSGRIVHVFMVEADPDELGAARRSMAREQMLQQQDERDSPWV